MEIMTTPTWENRLTENRTKKIYRYICDELLPKYPEEKREIIKKRFLEDIGRKCIDCGLQQLYSFHDMIPESSDEYFGFKEVIEKIFGLDRNIVDIGGGYVPAFAKKVSRAQVKARVGTITVIDPALVISELQNVTLIKESFTPETELPSCNLITSISPCPEQLADTIIDYACRKDIDFCIGLCSCPVEKFRTRYPIIPITQRVLCRVYDNRILSIKEKVESQNSRILDTIILPENYNCCTPIIISRSRKR